MKIKRNISIDIEDQKFIEDNSINLSKFIRTKIRELSGKLQEKGLNEGNDIKIVTPIKSDNKKEKENVNT